MNIDYLVDNLETITSDNFSPIPWFFENIYPYINVNNRLTEGSLSSIYNIPNTDAIMKVTTPCEKLGALAKSYCSNMHSKNQIIRIPSDTKLLIMIANYLSEAIVGGILNKIQEYTPHFASIYGIFFSRYYDTSYMLMERISTNTHDVIQTKIDFYLFLFQIAHALSVGQIMFKFTHFDLHLGSIGYILTDINENRYGFTHNNNLYTVNVKNTGFLAKIFNFEFSRVEGNTHIINPLIDYLPVSTFSVFNPYYDFMSLIGSLLYYSSGSDVRPLSQKFINLFSTDEINELLGVVFGESIDIQTAIDKYYNGWRPNRPDIQPTDHPFATINDIVAWLANKLQSFGFLEITEAVPTTDYQSQIFERKILPMEIIDKGIQIINNTNNNTFRWKSFNYTGERSGEFKTLVIHQIFINSRIIKNNGYKFASICCKMDPIIFMQNHYGVAINGGFYDLGNTYEMLGSYRQPFRNHYYESNRSISDLYNRYFGLVTVEDDKISIIKAKDANISQNAFTSGPLLIWNGMPQITEDTLKETRDGIYIFQCQLGRLPSDERYIGNKFNCDKIYPGELAHGSNVNPRSMLVLREDSFDVIFVVVEGRNERSDGADFLDLIKIAQGLRAKHAINLDGGRSSNMAWRSPNDNNVIGVTNRINAYPVGNILAVMK